MRLSAFRGLAAAACAAALPLVPVHGEAATTPDLPTTSETIQVTATRFSEDILPVPVAITVIGGEQLEARGAIDLPSALALIGGVTAGRGGDNGPAGSVPELWGLREADAFLLVVDGVPWGGAFNPDLPTLSLVGVERIEVLRGAAPVLFGATSFVGVIHVIHRAPGTGKREIQLSAGNFGSGSVAIALPLPARGEYHQSLIADASQEGFKDDRTEYQRAHLLYRGERSLGRGLVHIDADLSFLAQDPASPHPRQGRVLSSRVPLDANHNPAGAKLDENRFHLSGSYEVPVSKGSWSTSLAFTQSDFTVLRGFLGEDLDAELNAHGFAQDRNATDFYLDSHLALALDPHWHLVAGVDHLYGRGEAESDLFAYGIALNGNSPPALRATLPLERAELEDERNFSGLYLQTEWTPTARFRLQAGVRLNRTQEDREGEAEPVNGEEEEEGEERVNDSRSTSRGSGMLGISYQAWSDGSDALWLFADYRNSFKPAAIDFGPEVEGGILKPETAESYEVGIRGRLLDDRWEWQLSGFQMDFENLVLAQNVNGFPTLINAGSQRFTGIELETELRLRSDLRWLVAASLHDPKFRDFEQLFDGVPTQLRGKRLEMAAREMASTGLVYSPARGFFASAIAEFVGERFLNKRNTALAPSYTTWSAGLGYRFATFELRLDGRNLSDTRPPVAESELGDAQYYRLPARRLDLTFRRSF